MNVEKIGYGLASFVPALIIYYGDIYSMNRIILMFFVDYCVLFVVLLICIFAVLFYIFLKHFGKNKSISKKYQPYVLIALITASPISFPLYWLYFFIIKKTELNEPGFPLSRE